MFCFRTKKGSSTELPLSFSMQEKGLEQNPEPKNPHRKEPSGVQTWVCKQSVKQVRTSLCFMPYILLHY